MTTPNTPTSQGPMPLIGLDPYNGKIYDLRPKKISRKIDRKLFMNGIHRLAGLKVRYSRKAWRLKKEIEKITDTPQYKKASDNAMHNTLIGAPVEVIFRPDGSVEVPRYQIGGNDCEICR